MFTYYRNHIDEANVIGQEENCGRTSKKRRGICLMKLPTREGVVAPAKET